MKKFACLCLMVVMLMPAMALGQGDGKSKTKFYNFDDLLIDGEYKKPQVLNLDARQKVKFERLLALKKAFLPKLKASAKDAALR